MKRLDLEKASDLLGHIDPIKYPLIRHYLDYDDCYMDDSWIKYSIYYDETDIPVAVIAKRLPEEQIGHILILEVDKDLLGKGIGKQLVQYGIKGFNINEVTVNEQNPQAVGVYEHIGFKTYKRTDLDEQGNPYPLLYMKLG